MRVNYLHSGIKVFITITILLGLTISGCDYYDAIEPENLRSPFESMDISRITADYRKFDVDGVILEMTENDYINGCGRFLFHIEDRIEQTDDLSHTIHILGSGGDPEEFTNEIRITIPYNIYSFRFETVYSNLVIYKSDLNWRSNHIFKPEDFEALTGCVHDKENHTVSVTANTLRGRYVIGRP